MDNYGNSSMKLFERERIEMIDVIEVAVKKEKISIDNCRETQMEHDHMHVAQ
jgi:hypothetical protein